jgi:hypothetical protein
MLFHSTIISRTLPQLKSRIANNVTSRCPAVPSASCPSCGYECGKPVGISSMAHAMHFPDMQKRTQHSSRDPMPAVPDIAIAYGMERTPTPMTMLKMETTVWKSVAPSGVRGRGSGDTGELCSCAAGRSGSSDPLMPLQRAGCASSAPQILTCPLESSRPSSCGYDR